MALMAGALGAGSILGFAGGLLGSASAKEAQEDAQDWQRHVMQHMTQWRMEDLRAAGLNPILAGGALAQGSAGAGIASMPANPLAQAASEVAQAPGRYLAAKGQQAQNAILNSNAVSAAANAVVAPVEADLRLKETAARTSREWSQDESNREAAELARKNAELSASSAAKMEAEADLLRARLPAAQAEGELYKAVGPAGTAAREILPFVRTFLGK